MGYWLSDSEFVTSTGKVFSITNKKWIENLFTTLELNLKLESDKCEAQEKGVTECHHMKADSSALDT